MCPESELGLHVKAGHTCDDSFTLIFDEYYFPSTTIQHYQYD